MCQNVCQLAVQARIFSMRLMITVFHSILQRTFPADKCHLGFLLITDPAASKENKLSECLWEKMASGDTKRISAPEKPREYVGLLPGRGVLCKAEKGTNSL